MRLLFWARLLACFALIAIGMSFHAFAQETRDEHGESTDQKQVLWACAKNADKEACQILLNRLPTEATLREACDANDAKSCARLAEVLLLKDAATMGDDIEVLHHESVSFTIKACDLSYGYACFLAGMAFAYDDDARSAQLFERSCDLADPRGCSMFALYLSNGTGVKEDKKRAEQIFESLCKAGRENDCDWLEQIRSEWKAGLADEE